MSFLQNIFYGEFFVFILNPNLGTTCQDDELFLLSSMDKNYVSGGAAD
jgi:hypothetical protein